MIQGSKLGTIAQLFTRTTFFLFTIPLNGSCANALLAHIRRISLFQKIIEMFYKLPWSVRQLTMPMRVLGDPRV